ncbi:MAG: hypothetical protein IJ744_10505 [Lachnospiraceae bacterium]|nr:hypothetical protein [Lachnospiraceae bacterium]
MGKRGRCPYCAGELEFPDGLTKGICMYCGKTLKADDLISGDMSALITEASKNYEEALSHIEDLFVKYPDLMKSFNETDYEESFEAFMEAERGLVEQVDLACRMASEEVRYERLTALANKLMDAIMAAIDNGGKARGKREVRKNDYKMQQVVYIIPMIRELHLDISEEFSDAIITAWKERNNGDIYYKGDYHNLINGFRKRRICYITTAVCDTFGKPDNCYELMRFRQFRDDYLLLQPEGEALVAEYYDLAPRIVASIDLQPDRDKIYADIWEQYLSPCLSMIEEKQLAQCEEHYIKMVRTLEEIYD